MAIESEKKRKTADEKILSLQQVRVPPLRDVVCPSATYVTMVYDGALAPAHRFATRWGDARRRLRARRSARDRRPRRCARSWKSSCAPPRPPPRAPNAPTRRALFFSFVFSSYFCLLLCCCCAQSV